MRAEIQYAGARATRARHPARIGGEGGGRPMSLIVILLALASAPRSWT